MRVLADAFAVACSLLAAGLLLMAVESRTNNVLFALAAVAMGCLAIWCGRRSASEPRSPGDGPAGGDDLRAEPGPDRPSDQSHPKIRT